MSGAKDAALTRRSMIAGCGAALASAAVPAWAGPPRQQITRGVAISSWLDQPDGSSKPPSFRVLAYLRKQGFENVRLPIDPDRFAIGGTATKVALEELARVLRRLDQLGFSVTLDIHPQGWIGEDLSRKPEAKEALVQAWSTIAQSVASTPPDKVFLEFLNEPPLRRDDWIMLRDRLAETVRQACPHHTIIWGANRYQTIAETVDCAPLPDPNSQVAVHYYSPFAFTHQCQSWGDSPRSKFRHLPFPAGPDSPEVVDHLSRLDSDSAAYLRRELADGWSVERINTDFERLAAWARSVGTQASVNEFGVLGHCADRVSRVRWTRAVREAAERHAIGWTYWEVDRGFGFIGSREDIGEVDTGILEALFGA